MSQLWYDHEEDILGIQLSKKRYWKSIEVAENVVIDISKDGDIVGIEILKAKDAFKQDIPAIISSAKRK